MKRKIREVIINVLGSISDAKPGIHILNAHFVKPTLLNREEYINSFREFITYISGKATLLRIEQAVEMIVKNKIPKNEVFVAFTYDDGYEECYSVIAPVLEEFNCNAAFFINSNYVESDAGYQKNFHDRVVLHTKKPMNWEQIKSLHDRGHIIGSHTLDHFCLSLLSESEKINQIKNNKLTLEKMLNYKCEYFAWPYGQLSHFDNQSLQVASNYHTYIFSGTDYKNYFSMDGKVLNRRQIEAYWPKSHVNYFLSVNKKL